MGGGPGGDGDGFLRGDIIFNANCKLSLSHANCFYVSGSKDLQNVNITLRILFRPRPDALPNIYTTLGSDYDDRVLPSITNEV